MQIAGSVRHARQASLAQQAPHRCDFLARTRRLPQVAASHRRAVCRLAVARVRACLDVQMRVTPRHVHHPCTEVKQGQHAIHIAYPPHAVPCPRQGCILLAHIMLGDGSLQGRCMVVHMPNALALEQVSTVMLRCCSAWWSRGVRHAPRNCPVRTNSPDALLRHSSCWFVSAFDLCIDLTPALSALAVRSAQFLNS